VGLFFPLLLCTDSFFRNDYVRYHLDDVARAKGLKITQTDKDKYLQQLKESNLLGGEEDTKWMREEVDAMRAETQRQLGYTPSMLTSIPFIHSASFFSPALRERYQHLHPLFFHLNTSASFDPRLIRHSVLAQLSRLNASLYVESKTMLPNILLRWLGDAEEMAHSVEGHSAHPSFPCCANVPFKQCSHNLYCVYLFLCAVAQVACRSLIIAWSTTSTGCTWTTSCTSPPQPSVPSS